ncbi:TetR family transcriptional regulator [Nocardia sp. NBC_00508]|uniref:TetR/AcrR family transcriptional regulator n=1 Tax=Nocardia sp. NBC_00508 TaxID=2975992 RepID=UPI002E8012B8|nr:TetR family transcriptional regulator [Nocardia sp. NBC_00508]WUD66762.1 TetR family transcriptional regulator [Nocardia sp. NBC_00508]
MPQKAAPQHRRPTQQRAKETREHILGTAARLFCERGIAETSTNRIAAAAGLSIGTVYRYFPDRAAIVDELLERLLENTDRRFTHWVSDLSQRPTPQLLLSAPQVLTEMLELFTEELVAHAYLVRALVGGVQFYSSGIPEFEPRLRLLVKVLLIQLLGPGDDHKYDMMTYVLINTGFAAVLRTTALEVDDHERREAIAMTAQMIGAWLDAEVRAAQLPDTP